MEYDFIKRFEAANYGCLRDVKVDLTRLHAFIGPNDSGKSTILRAVRTLSRIMAIAVHNEEKVAARFNMGIELARNPALRADFGDMSYVVSTSNNTNHHVFTTAGQSVSSSTGHPVWRGWLVGRAGSDRQTRVLSGDAHLVRLDPDAMREPSTLIPESDRLRLYDERGRGLPGVYDAIVNRGDDAFQRIRDGLRRRFPTVKNLRLKNVSESTKVLEIELTSGERVPAEFMSEGLLYYLGFVAIQHLEPTSVLLVEEPENGLHPVRVAEVISILREVSEQGTQVLIATHSPLVVNELRSDEVTIVTRSAEAGTEVRRISETPNFEQRSKVYALGELWLSYANGTDEGPLLHPPANGS